MAYLGGFVKWEESPLCGIDGDNIWTPADETALGKDTHLGPPTGELDSFLMP